jgi:predicted NAD/FAD-binding protein
MTAQAYQDFMWHCRHTGVESAAAPQPSTAWVKGVSLRYVETFTAAFRDGVWLSSFVTKIERTSRAVVRHSHGHRGTFDRTVIAAAPRTAIAAPPANESVLAAAETPAYTPRR